jgi:hypothetical protein
MKWIKLIPLLGIITFLIVVLSYGLAVYSANISIANIETSQTKVTCSLQWHGPQSTLVLTTLADCGRTNNDYTISVNNGDIFNVPVIANYSWVEISYYGKTVSLHSDGNNASLIHVGYS